MAEPVDPHPKPHSYEFQKFLVAIELMATRDLPLRDRVYGAWDTFKMVGVPIDEVLPKGFRKLLDEINGRLTEIKDGDPARGQVQNSLDEMTDNEVVEVAELIFNAFCETVWPAEDGDDSPSPRPFLRLVK
jgi:hypothetical protein